MTVGDLVKLLSSFDQDLPVLVDGYEWGFQAPHAPIQIIVERKPCASVAGDWDTPDGISWGEITESARPVVVIPRSAA